ncbi:thiol-disulfide oxidoreductase ResA [Heyndrickxia sporothermodurans]|nr:thiol-disulfide oxidoreductase ResA [Heyndrickxia sporothermodurans]
MVIRTSILIILFLMVGYALYQNLNKDDKTVFAKEGKPAINFQLKNLNKEKVTLSDYKGKVVLLNFWGTWCEPCKKEMPAIESIYNKYKKDGFEVLAINLNESAFAISSFLKQNKVNIPVLLDKNDEVNKAYNVYRLPASFFIDRKGKIVRVHEGEMNEKQIEKWVKELL